MQEKDIHKMESPLTYLKTRSTNFLSIKIDKELKIVKNKFEINLKTVYTNEVGKIIAVFYDIPLTQNAVSNFTSWIGRKRDWWYDLALDGYKEQISDWYFNQNSIRLGYSEITVKCSVKPQAYLLLAHTDISEATLTKWEYTFIDNKMYFIEFNSLLSYLQNVEII
jgi:hypothetical protein